MAWATPPTWAAGQNPTFTKMNVYSTNLTALLNRSEDSYLTNEGSDYSTTSTSFVDVDATNYNLSVTTIGGNILVGVGGFIGRSGANNVIFFDITVDGVREGGDDGLLSLIGDSVTDKENVFFPYLITGLAAATYAIKLQWKVSAQTGILFAGAGTADGDVHSSFWAKEV